LFCDADRFSAYADFDVENLLAVSCCASEK